ncbi:MAG: LamG-like jellyroll fold domain-containing protein [Bacteroidales bacterium]|nr:LamG-like jellyroll fold domain-containing protein [Bacteroidales bacterium]
MKTLKFILICILSLILSCCSEESAIESKLKSTPGLIAYWTFDGKDKYHSKGKENLELINGTQNHVQIIKDGPISGHSILLDGTNYLYITHKETGLLDIHTNCVTVMAWVKWSGEQIGFVGGMWNEYQDGGKRQYGLFVSLPAYNGENQVCGHISKTGRPTPPFPYSIDYSASKQKVEPNKWCFIAFTYDGEYIKSYYNGVFEKREPELISNTSGFPGCENGLTHSKNPHYFPDGMGNNGSDFTVGAVLLKSGMGNFFKGQIGGLAVFDRALTDNEITFFVNR